MSPRARLHGVEPHAEGFEPPRIVPAAGGYKWRSRYGTVQNAKNLELWVSERGELLEANPAAGPERRPGGTPQLRTLWMQTTGAQVDITEKVFIGDAPFTRSYSLFNGQPPKPRRIACSSLSWVAKIHTPGQSAVVSVACHDGHSDGLTDYFAWQTLAVAATRSASQYTGAGVVLQGTVILKAATVNVYPMLLDLASSTPPTSGVTTPIPGSVGALLSNVGVQDNYADQNSQGILAFANGLWFALSTTPDVWTDPGAGNTAVGSFTLGV